MPNTHCPYLINWNAQGQPIAPISYPSFENHCGGQEENSSLLLTDQATYCLSGSHGFCPIYQALAAHEADAETDFTEQPAPWHPFQRPAPPPPAAPSDHAQPHPFVPWEQRGSTPARAGASRFPRAQTGATARATPNQPARGEEAYAPHNQSDYAHHGPFTQSTGDDPFLADDLAEPLLGDLTGDLPLDHSQEVAEAAWLHPAARWWAWAGAVLLFFAVIGTGSLIAAYAGWQLALEQLATARAGEISTLANAPAAVQPQMQPLYIVMTATNEPAITDPNRQPAPIVVAPRTGQGVKPDPITGADNATPQSGAPSEFSAAVTATAVIVVPLPTRGTNGNTPPLLSPTVPATATPVPIQLPPANAAPTAAPIIDVQVQVPTRRETPIFDIPTSTPTPEIVEPTPTNTLVPILGTPIVVFAADLSAVPPGKCTNLRWRVENVREVYYENLPMFGAGDRQECLDEDPDTFALTVVFADGQTKIYTTTVGIIEPTLTPSVTPSFTPEIAPTETWTPLPPTPTPTPDVVYGTTLSINGENPTRCNAGESCTIGVLATNTGDALDTLAIELVAGGNWPALLCSQIGTCGSPRLVVANVGPANTVFVNLQITIPADSAGQRTNYALRSVSEGAGGAVTSQVTELTVTVNE